MLTRQATPEMIKEWKSVWEQNRAFLRPNRRTGKELAEYLQKAYPAVPVDEERARRAVIGNVLGNACFLEKLPAGKAPAAVVFRIARTGTGIALYERQDEEFSGMDILVGIELETGYFLAEGSSLLWDELFFWRGLDEKDLENYYLVAEYVACRDRFERKPERG